jgi:hypothetical protein
LNNKFCVELVENCVENMFGSVKLVENCVENMFGSVVVFAFQIIFRAEMHVNDVFFIFNISRTKRFKTYKIY